MEENLHSIENPNEEKSGMPADNQDFAKHEIARNLLTSIEQKQKKIDELIEQTEQDRLKATNLLQNLHDCIGEADNFLKVEFPPLREKIINPENGLKAQLEHVSRFHDDIANTKNSCDSLKSEIDTAKANVYQTSILVSQKETELSEIFLQITSKQQEIETLLQTAHSKSEEAINIFNNLRDSKTNIERFVNDDFNPLVEKISNPENGLLAKLKEATELVEQIDITKNNSLKINGDIESYKVQSEQKLFVLDERAKSVENLYNEYLTIAEGSNKSKKQEIDDFYGTVKKQSESFFKIVNRTKEFEKETFGDSNIEGLQQRLASLEKQTIEQKNRWNESYETLFKKIEGLLPGATSTGLAKAYDEQKDNYKIPYIVWSSVFCITMIVMIFYAVITVHDVSTLTQAAIRLLGRVPFFVPAIWLAIFASKQQSQNKRLEQEYVNKAAVAKTFEGHKREIQSLPDSEYKEKLSIELLAVMVENVKNNPSNTLKDSSHNDSPPFSIPAINSLINKKDSPES